ncbi:uncharacterized protein LOC106652014 [Trichogramma pretiosum]|uniref:uncharacterized protein LOC106652014 n=1 Tax=Trichogramma pretiosum TaxID=7493 RepID=UPI0006C9C840|nr:uncharacterized protein LOC106652014 [Trichogramma pretiosum]
MTTFGIFNAVVIALNGLIFPIILGSVSPAVPTNRTELSYYPENDKIEIVYSENFIENTTVYYGACDRHSETTQKKCIIRRVRANFWGASPKVDECNVTLHSESGNFITSRDYSITSLGKDRAILKWLEKPGQKTNVTSHLRFSIVNFSDCTVKTTKLSEDLDQLDKWIPNDLVFYESLSDNYIKGEDDFEVFSFDKMSVNKSSINAEGIASKVGKWLTYPTYLGHLATIFPLSKDQGYLLMEVSHSMESLMTVALIQPNGQRQNLTHIKSVNYPVVSLDNGLIGICAQDMLKDTTMKCTQFKLGDKEINWFSVSNVKRNGRRPAIYNLPMGEGFLMNIFTSDIYYPSIGKYLVKIGLDGKLKQFVDPSPKCSHSDYSSDKIFKDDLGRYCLSTACIAWTEDQYNYLRFFSNCFGLEAFENIS